MTRPLVWYDGQESGIELGGGRAVSGEPPKLLADELLRYSSDDTRQVAALVQRWPNFRRHIAYAVLGQAIAVADSFGCDVESFIVDLRKRYPKPAELLPPKGN